MRLAIFCLMAIAISGCAMEKRPPCVSRCGMLLGDVGNGAMSCEVLQEAEDAVTSAYDELKDKDPRLAKDQSCKALFGWQLHLKEQVVGSLDGEIYYVGLSNCESKDMTLMANQDWRHGSYPHEFVHAAQNCQPPPEWSGDEDDERQAGHTGWSTMGIDEMIRQFRRGFR